MEVCGSNYILNMMIRAVRGITHKLQLVRANCFGQNYGEARQRALWASKFIQIIRGDQQSSNPSAVHQTLSDELRGCDLDLTLQPYKSESIEQEMKAMFKTGIVLNSSIFHQSRIQRGQIDSNTSKVNQKPFVFIPTVLVTREIFKYIKRDQWYQTLFYGFYGVGKTASFIAYAILSGFINKYLYMAVDSKDSSECRLAEELINKKFIEKARKVFYYSFAGDKYEFEKCIYAQLDELTKQQKDKLKNQPLISVIQMICQRYTDDLLYQPLGQEFNDTLNTLVIIDQINALASKYRKYNEEIDQINSMTKFTQEYRLGRINLAKFRFMSVQQHKYLIQDFIKYVKERVILNSTVDIETYQLQKQRSKYKTMYLIDKHVGLQKQKLQYYKRLQTDWGQRSFKEYFWEELQLRFTKPGRTDAVFRLSSSQGYGQNSPSQGQNQLSQTQQIAQSRMPLSDAKSIFFDEMQEYTIPATWRFLQVRQALQNTSVFIESFLQNPTQIGLQNLIQYIAKEIDDLGKRQYIKRMSAQSLNCTVENIQKKADLYFEIYTDLQGNFQLQPMGKQIKMETDKKDYEFDNFKNANLFNRFNQLLQLGLIDQELLQFQQVNGNSLKKIVFFYSRAELRKIIHKVLYQIMLDFTENNQQILPELITKKFKNRSLLGIFVERSFIQSIFHLKTEFALETVKLAKPILLQQFQRSISRKKQTLNQRAKVIKKSLKYQLQQKDKSQKPTGVINSFSIAGRLKVSQFLSKNVINTAKYHHLRLLLQLSLRPNEDFALIVDNSKSNHLPHARLIADENEGAADRLKNNPIFDFAVLRYSKQNNEPGVYVWQTFDFTVTDKEEVKMKIQKAHDYLIQYQRIITEGINAFSSQQRKSFVEIADWAQIQQLLSPQPKGEEERDAQSSSTVFNISNQRNPVKGTLKMLKISKNNANSENKAEILNMDAEDYNQLIKIGERNEKIKIVHTIICDEKCVNEIAHECYQGNENNNYSLFTDSLGNDNVEIRVASLSKVNINRASLKNKSAENNFKLYEQLRKQPLP